MPPVDRERESQSGSLGTFTIFAGVARPSPAVDRRKSGCEENSGPSAERDVFCSERDGTTWRNHAGFSIAKRRECFVASPQCISQHAGYLFHFVRGAFRNVCSGVPASFAVLHRTQRHLRVDGGNRIFRVSAARIVNRGRSL